MKIQLDFPTILQYGDNVEVRGVVGQGQFILDLLSDYLTVDPVESDRYTSLDDVDLPVVHTQPLHISFDVSGAWDVVANCPQTSTCSCGTSAKRFGFRPGESFVCSIAVKKEYFVIRLNEMQLSSSEHLVPVSSIHGIELDGDSNIQSVHYGSPEAIQTRITLQSPITPASGSEPIEANECCLSIDELLPSLKQYSFSRTSSMRSRNVGGRAKSEGNQSSHGHEERAKPRRTNSYQIFFSIEDGDLDELETRLKYDSVEQIQDPNLPVIDDSEFQDDYADSGKPSLDNLGNFQRRRSQRRSSVRSRGSSMSRQGRSHLAHNQSSSLDNCTKEEYYKSPYQKGPNVMFESWGSALSIHYSSLPQLSYLGRSPSEDGSRSSLLDPNSSYPNLHQSPASSRRTSVKRRQKLPPLPPKNLNVPEKTPDSSSAQSHRPQKSRRTTPAFKKTPKPVIYRSQVTLSTGSVPTDNRPDNLESDKPSNYKLTTQWSVPRQNETSPSSNKEENPTSIPPPRHRATSPKPLRIITKTDMRKEMNDKENLNRTEAREQVQNEFSSYQNDGSVLYNTQKENWHVVNNGITPMHNNIYNPNLQPEKPTEQVGKIIIVREDTGTNLNRMPYGKVSNPDNSNKPDELSYPDRINGSQYGYVRRIKRDTDKHQPMMMNGDETLITSPSKESTVAVIQDRVNNTNSIDHLPIDLYIDDEEPDGAVGNSLTQNGHAQLKRHMNGGIENSKGVRRSVSRWFKRFSTGRNSDNSITVTLNGSKGKLN